MMRRRGRSLAALTLAAVGLGAAVSGCRAIPPGSETLQQVEERRFAAMVAQNMPALEPMLAEELNYTHSSGSVETKPQFLETIRTGRLRYEALEIKHLDVRQYGNVALLTGRAAARVQLGGGQPQVLDLRFTDAYVHRDGHWQLVAWQSTRIP